MDDRDKTLSRLLTDLESIRSKYALSYDTADAMRRLVDSIECDLCETWE